MKNNLEGESVFNRRITRSRDQKEVKSLQDDTIKQPGHPAQLVYTPKNVETSGEYHPTMVLMVDSDAYANWKKDKSIPIIDVVDSFQVLKYEQGRSGILNKPSKSELHATFGTTNQDEIVNFMLEHGISHGKGI